MVFRRAKKSVLRKKRRGGMRKRGFRKARDVGDYASLSVKRSVNPPGGGNFQTNGMYELRNVELEDYDRAIQVAQAYQHYRIKKITLTLKPTFDTYQQGVGTGSRPNLYYMIDKSGSIPANVTLEGLKQMGAKAHRFDEKPFTISWRPSVLTGDATAPGVLGASQYRISPWLSTAARPLDVPWAPSVVDHLGIFWYVEQLFNGTVQYNAEIEVQFQFKKPLMVTSPGAPMATKTVVATIDDSSDGIVGGPDSNNQPF